MGLGKESARLYAEKTECGKAQFDVWAGRGLVWQGCWARIHLTAADGWYVMSEEHLLLQASGT